MKKQSLFYIIYTYILIIFLLLDLIFDSASIVEPIIIYQIFATNI